nr:flagellar basal-body rod protein FlgF [uncultured Cohaesibacter sp.]
MENLQLIGLTRQMVMRRKMDVIANNLANINTAGYKSDNLLFKEYVMPVAEMNDFRSSDKKLSYVQDDVIVLQFEPGSIVATGNPANAAINDNSSFFVVQTPQGERYTRNGEFEINSQGQLVTTDGYQVMGNGGPINVTQEDANLHIARDGLITSDQGELGQLQVVTFDNLQTLKKEGTSLFIGENPVPVETTKIMGGHVEQSNVNGVIEISRMIEVNRSYGSLARALKDTDDLRETAIDKLGRLNA